MILSSFICEIILHSNRDVTNQNYFFSLLFYCIVQKSFISWNLFCSKHLRNFVIVDELSYEQFYVFMGSGLIFLIFNVGKWRYFSQSL